MGIGGCPGEASICAGGLKPYTGRPAKTVGPGDFWELFWADRRQFVRFIGWIREMRGYAGSDGQD